MALSDGRWAALKAALDEVRPGTGRPLADERRTVEGVIWRLRDGARWRALPAEYGPWWRAAQLHIRWAGARARLFARPRDAGGPELAEVLVDGTVVRARQKAGGEGGPARTRSAARAAASGRGPAPRATPAAGRSPSRSRPARPRGWAPPAPTLPAAVAALGVVSRVACDRGYSSEAWRAAIREHGAEPVVPARPTHRNAPGHDRAAHRRRRHVENMRAKLKEWRAVATRYEKTAASYAGDLHLAAGLEWLPNRP